MNIKSLLSLTLLAVVLFSCDEEPSESSKEQNSSWLRINERIITRYDGKTTKDVFSYDNDELIKVISYDDLDEPGTFKETGDSIIYSYTGKTVIATIYAEGEKSRKVDYTVEEGVLTSTISYLFRNDEWMEWDKNTFKYENGKLINHESFFLESDGNWILEKGNDFVYGKEYLAETKPYYPMINSDGKTFKNYTMHIDYIYNGKNLVEEKHYDLDKRGNKLLEQKFAYDYIGSQRIKSTTFRTSTNGWEESIITGDITYYEYNKQGLLSGESSDFGLAVSYTYGAGEGNAKLFYQELTNILSNDPVLQ